MELKREKEFVNQYHYNARNLEWEKEHEAPKTGAQVNFQLVKKDQENKVTSLITILQMTVVHDDFVINAMISQMSHIQGRIVNEIKELSQPEVQELAAPLLDMVKRLTFEVTEIALDRPGVNLEF
ncbi:DUF1149 family protein [Streptococcus caprae]|uniref:DUF1149 family protein n=1 Tax=Streptococcus caprae TaxID=1640501 RepID=A0ABV8CYP0_9STRE